MEDSEHSRSQHIIGLPFTVSCLSHALRSALSALRHRDGSKPGAPPRSWLDYSSMKDFHHKQHWHQGKGRGKAPDGWT